MIKYFEALQAGRELSNPATWKNRQTTINLLVVVLGVIAAIARALGAFDVSDELIAEVSVIVAALLGLANAYLVPATSKKVGL